MKRLAYFIPLAAIGLMAHFARAGTWDSAATLVATCTSTGSNTVVTVPTGVYLSGYCDAAAYVGASSPTLADGGPTCVNQDGGSIPVCELRQANRMFYIKLMDRDTSVACMSVSGTANCMLFRARD